MTHDAERPVLYIGNKNYSSWSLRAWLLLKQAGIEFEEVKLRLDFDPASPFKQALAQVAPSGRVPVLVDRGFAVWDTLAIAETLAERHPDKELWPADAHRRARARSLCAEMHAGFGALRNHLPMNIEASLPEIGPRILREHADVRADVARIEAIWSEQLAGRGGPFLFGRFSIADAFFAPVCSRFRSYAVPVSATAEAYVAHILALPAMQAWSAEACREHTFLADDEPYRTQR
ncbi:MAG: glutathione S-transferase family protein [Proteobacteria bacterium]|nr:glutathione S-transferase family protein [Pseudomonadota bacterium]